MVSDHPCPPCAAAGAGTPRRSPRGGTPGQCAWPAVSVRRRAPRATRLISNTGPRDDAKMSRPLPIRECLRPGGGAPTHWEPTSAHYPKRTRRVRRGVDPHPCHGAGGPSRAATTPRQLPARAVALAAAAATEPRGAARGRVTATTRQTGRVYRSAVRMLGCIVADQQAQPDQLLRVTMQWGAR